MLRKISFLNFDWRYCWLEFDVEDLCQNSYWPRAMLKGLKKALLFLLFLFLILLLAWNQVPKMYEIKQKLYKGTKTCLCGTLWYWIVLFALYGFVWSYMALWGLIRPRMVLMMLFTVIIWLSLRDLLWSCMALNGLVWPCIALYCLVLPCIALYGLVWPFMVSYGILWSFLAVIDPNLFGLV